MDGYCPGYASFAVLLESSRPFGRLRKEKGKALRLARNTLHFLEVLFLFVCFCFVFCFFFGFCFVFFLFCFVLFVCLFGFFLVASKLAP